MSARGLWGTHENTFFDIGSLTLYADSDMAKSLETNEQQKFLQ